MKSEPIRRAIEAGDYSLAASLWQEWAGELRAAGSAGDAADCRAAAELVEWSRNVLLCARAHTVDSLHALHVAGTYGSTLSRGDSRRPGISSRSL